MPDIFVIIIYMALAHPWIALILSPFILFGLVWVGAWCFIWLIYGLETLCGRKPDWFDKG